MNKLFILDYYTPGSRGLEIGVWKGEFSKEIADRVKPSALYLCDPWKFFPEYSDRWYGGTQARSQADMDAIHQGVIKMFENYSNVHILKDVSDNLTNHIEEKSLDWTYIDGNHSYEFVLRDLEISLKLIKPGGIISGDDYDEGNDIEKALAEFLTKYEQQIEEGIIQQRQFVIKFKQ